MRIIHTMLAFALACLLTSCATTSIDGTIQRSLPKTCQLIETAHLAFTTVALTGNIKSSTVRKEQAAYEGASVICADPSSVTTGNALILAAQTYLVISTAMKEAKTHG